MTRDQAIRAAIDALKVCPGDNDYPHHSRASEIFLVLEALGLVKFEEPPLPAYLCLNARDAILPTDYAPTTLAVRRDAVIAALRKAGFEVYQTGQQQQGLGTFCQGKP